MTSSDYNTVLPWFEDLYRSTRTDLLGYLVRRTRNPDLAADLLAETYLVAWRKPESVPAGDEARPWLFGVARNLLLKDLRRQRTLDATMERLAHEIGRLHDAESAREDERAERVAAALAGLSQLDREIVTLNAWEGLAPREIAVVVGTSVNVVRIRLHRARARLRREVTGDLAKPDHGDFVAATING